LIYLDSAAVVKLIRAEQHSAELTTWLAGHPGSTLVSSVLVEVEVARALRRSAPQALAAVPAVLTRLTRHEIDPTVRATAAAYDDRDLRSLDAIHLATAQILAGESTEHLDAFVSYDKRLLASAAAAGLPTASPGT
jgi:predicted nucleic acid-binding protein